MTEIDQVADAAAFLRERLGWAPRLVLVLGSGLGDVAGGIADPVTIPYPRIPHFPAATVQGHAGALVAGTWQGVSLAILRGRAHLYEGWPPEAVAFPIRVLRALGADRLLLTSAVGAIRPGLRPGELILLTDHLNFMFRNPLIGAVVPGEQRFPDMSEPYDPDFRKAALQSAAELRIGLTTGVYAAVLGPNYETPAEIRMLARCGADVIGMSTVPEVIAARALGMRVLAISCVTNLAAGAGGTLTHAEVLEVGGQAADRLTALLGALLPRVAPVHQPAEVPR